MDESSLARRRQQLAIVENDENKLDSPSCPTFKQALGGAIRSTTRLNNIRSHPYRRAQAYEAKRDTTEVVGVDVGVKRETGLIRGTFVKEGSNDFVMAREIAVPADCKCTFSLLRRSTCFSPLFKLRMLKDVCSGPEQVEGGTKIDL